MDEIYEKVINRLQTTSFKTARLEEIYDFLLDSFKLYKPIPLKKRSQYITIDGIGGSGKDTLINNLIKKNKFVAFREDNYDPFRGILKKYWDETPSKKYNPNIPVYLIACGKMYVNCSSLSQLLVNSNVVANRSFLSTIALSAVEGVNLKEMIKAFHSFPIVPDQKILLNCDPIVSYQRKAKDHSIGRSDNLNFLNKSYYSFLELTGHFQFTYVDTTHLTAKETFQKVNQLITVNL